MKRLKDGWSQLKLIPKLMILVYVALVITFAAELLCNVRFFTSRALTPVNVALSSLTTDSVLMTEQSDAGITFVKATGINVELVLAEPDIELQTASVTLAGEGAVSASFVIQDEANAYTPRAVYQLYCVPDDAQLATGYATVQSSGTVNEFRLRLRSTLGDSYTVTGVTLNARIPFIWQPLRMALVFSASLALLCALLLRGLNTTYRPMYWPHRLIVVLPLVLLMVFAGVFAQWILPQTPLFSGLTHEEAAEGKDTYAVLYETLRDGNLSVPHPTNPELLVLDNLYDQSERIAKSVSFPFDYSLFEEEYYVYFGIAPVVTLYAPYTAITGEVPTSRDVTLIMIWLSIAFIGLAVCGLAKRYAPDVNVFVLSLCCITAVFASGVMLLFSSADFYYLAELSFVGYAAGAIAFGLQASTQKRRWFSLVLYAFSGLCLALAVASRPTPAPMIAAMLAPVFIGELASKRAKLGEALAFLIPALLGVGAVLWYNAARFGNPFDFGATHQLTVTDVHWQQVRLTELHSAIYHYLLEPLTFTSIFPYVTTTPHAMPSLGRYIFQMSSAGVMAIPITWALCLMPLGRRELLPALQQERRWALLLPLIVSLPLMLLNYGVAGIILRYTCDFRLFYTLAAVACAMPVMSRFATAERRTLAVLCIGLCIVSIFISLGLMFDNERNYVMEKSPAIFYGLQRMFFPY